jgi:hypothetical protein
VLLHRFAFPLPPLSLTSPALESRARLIVEPVAELRRPLVAMRGRLEIAEEGL